MREVKLVQAQNNCGILFFCKPTQNRHELRFTFNIEKRRRFVQKQNFRLLTDCPCQKDTLALTVANLIKIAVGNIGCIYEMQRVENLLFIFFGEDSETTGIRVTPGCGDIKAGRELCAVRVRHHQCHFARAGIR